MATTLSASAALVCTTSPPFAQSSAPNISSKTPPDMSTDGGAPTGALVVGFEVDAAEPCGESERKRRARQEGE